MSTLKEYQVVMLPTKEKAPIIKDIDTGLNYEFGALSYNPDSVKGIPNFSKQMYQHLYILSDDEIKEGDWFVLQEKIYKCDKIHRDDLFPYYESNSKSYSGAHCKKIIATTDESLLYNHSTIREIQGVKMEGKSLKSLPQPSQGFIKKYCEKGGIDKVMVEYETSIQCYKCGKSEKDCINISKNCIGYFEEVNTLKVASNNTITIKPIKDSWSRKQLYDCIQYYYEYCQQHGYVTPATWYEKHKHF